MAGDDGGNRGKKNEMMGNDGENDGKYDGK